MRATTPSKIGMAPPPSEAFIRDEILDELGLSVSAAAKALGVRRATAFRSSQRQRGSFRRGWRSGSRRPSAWIWRRAAWDASLARRTSPCVAGKSALSAIGSRC